MYSCFVGNANVLSNELKAIYLPLGRLIFFLSGKYKPVADCIEDVANPTEVNLLCNSIAQSN